MSDKNYEETTRYNETYCGEEYNDYFANGHLTRFADEYNSEAKSGETKKSVESAKKNSALTSGLLTSVGGVVGATVITATVVVIAVLQITLLSVSVSQRSISAMFSIENAGDVKLTAYLEGEAGQYSQPIDISGQEFGVTFDSLIPGCLYELAIKDQDNKVHYSDEYMTEAYFHDAELTADETSAVLRFNLDNPENKDYYAAIDGNDDIPREFITLSGSAYPAVANFVNLEPDKEYTVTVYDADGLYYYYKKVRTAAIRDPIRYELTVNNNASFSIAFDTAQIEGDAYTVVLNYVQTEDIISSASAEVIYEGFQPGTYVNLQLKDVETGELRLWINILMPDSYIEAM